MKQRKNGVCVYVLFEFSILLDGWFTVANYHFDFWFRAVRAHANIVVTVTDTIHRSEVTALVRRHADNLDFSSSLHASSLLFPLYSSINRKEKRRRKETVENLKPVARCPRREGDFPRSLCSATLLSTIIIGDTRVRQFLLFTQKLCS